MKRVAVILLIIFTAISLARENPFESSYSVKGPFREVKEALIGILAQKGFKTQTIQIRDRSPKLEILYFCTPKFPEDMPELSLLIPCRIYILEEKGGTRLGHINEESVISVFREKISDQRVEEIKNLGQRVRSAIKEVIRKWERQ